MNKFITAIKDLDLAAVKEFVDDPKWLNWSEPTGKNALHYLCGIGPTRDPRKAEAALDILKLILKKGGDINSIHRIEEKNCNYFPATPLWYAYTRGRNEKLYKYLLKKDADPSHCWWAIAWYDDIPAAKLWLKHGAKIGEDTSLNDLFIGAFGWKKFDFAYWLLTIGADVNATDPQGSTALIVAVKRKDEEHIKKLVAVGADPDHRNNKGDSARSIAQTKGPKRLPDLM